MKQVVKGKIVAAAVVMGLSGAVVMPVTASAYSGRHDNNYYYRHHDNRGYDRDGWNYGRKFFPHRQIKWVERKYEHGYYIIRVHCVDGSYANFDRHGRLINWYNTRPYWAR